jgi:hypothetical protein
MERPERGARRAARGYRSEAFSLGPGANFDAYQSPHMSATVHTLRETAKTRVSR